MLHLVSFKGFNLPSSSALAIIPLDTSLCSGLNPLYSSRTLSLEGNQLVL